MTNRMPRVFLATLILLLATGLTASRIGNVEGHQAERAIGWERNVAASVALASDDPVIVRPVAPATVDSGSQFQVVIEASNVEGLAGAQLVLTYDDSLLTFVSAQVGDDIAAAGSTCIALSNNDEQGLHLASACAAEDFQGFSGAPLVLWTVTFEAGGAAADTDTDIEVADEDLSLIDAASPPGDIPSIGERDTLTILAPEFIRVLFAFEGGARPKPDGWQKPVTVKFFVGQEEESSVDGTSTYDADANMAYLDVPRPVDGTYDITVVGPSTLTNIRRNVEVTADTAEVNLGTLPSGDANGNGIINIQDFGILRASYLKSEGEQGFDDRADFDCNGIVNIQDFGLLRKNYLKASPIEVQ